MIKEVSLSLLLSAAKMGEATPLVNLDSIQEMPLPSDPVLLAVPGKSIAPVLQPVQFCGEDVPLHEASVTRRWINVLLKQSAEREYMFMLRKRASRFFPIIEPIMAKFGIPRDFKYLPLVESAFTSTAVSHKGAAGYWQLMPETARQMGLRVNSKVDERNDIQKSTVAACRYLKELHKQFGSWTLVAAAYNSGSTHLSHRMERQGGQRNYYSLRLHPETRMYLYRVLAYKELMTRPRIYKDLLQPEVLAYLTFPIPREAKRSGPKLLPLNPPPADTSNDIKPDPTWGPRTRNLLDEVLAQIEELHISGTTNSMPQSDSMVTSPFQASTPFAGAGLMGLRVLRFRRSKLYQVYLAVKRKITPLFGWDWV